jgi:hypothetical protein
LNIAIVGVGPRGLAIFERLCANFIHSNTERTELFNEVNMYLIDPHPIGGAVWRQDQSCYLLMNTVASQITLYTDESVECEGPILKGPSLYEWTKDVIKDTRIQENKPEFYLEAVNMTPNTYPTRAFYGWYLESAYTKIIESLPNNINVFNRMDNVISIDSYNDGYQLGLEKESSKLYADKVIMALGHIESSIVESESHYINFAREHNLVYIQPANPADIDLSTISPKENVILRGLGLNFFDYMTLLTSGRGGYFQREGDELVYFPSGQEPLLIAGSRRGIPHHSRGENEKGASERHNPIYLTETKIEMLKKKETIDFKMDIWPLIAKEVEITYYTTWIRREFNEDKAQRFLEQYQQCSWKSIEESTCLKEAEIPEEIIFDWNCMEYPHQFQEFSSSDHFHDWLIEYLMEDIYEAYLGNKSGPLKAALDVLRDIRNEVRLLVDHGGITGNSYKEALRKWYTPFNAFLSIGPPARRIEEMVALIKSGVLKVVGAQATVTMDTNEKQFVISSPLVVGSIFEANALIEARLPEVDILHSRNLLINDLVRKGMAISYSIPDYEEDFNTGGLAVTVPPNRLIDKDGNPHNHLFAFGVPTEGVHWVTAAGVRPGVNSVTLIEADAIAREVIFGTQTKNVEGMYETTV